MPESRCNDACFPSLRLSEPSFVLLKARLERGYDPKALGRLALVLDSNILRDCLRSMRARIAGILRQPSLPLALGKHARR